MLLQWKAIHSKIHMAWSLTTEKSWQIFKRMIGMMTEIWKKILSALSLREEISHAKLNIQVIYPEHPDVL